MKIPPSKLWVKFYPKTLGVSTPDPLAHLIPVAFRRDPKLAHDGGTPAFVYVPEEAEFYRTTRSLLDAATYMHRVLLHLLTDGQLDAHLPGDLGTVRQKMAAVGRVLEGRRWGPSAGG